MKLFGEGKISEEDYKLVRLYDVEFFSRHEKSDILGPLLRQGNKKADTNVGEQWDHKRIRQGFWHRVFKVTWSVLFGF